MAAGGGGDALAALFVHRALSPEGERAVVASYSWDRFILDPQPGPRCPADFYGLGDRGVLEPGRRADINLIDLDNLGLHYPEQVRDLPGGAGRLIQRSNGYVETLVLGQTIVADGELTDSRPGGLVRGPRPMATA